MKVVVVVCVFERNCLNVPTSAFLWLLFARTARVHEGCAFGSAC